jgi:rubredoxin
MKHHDCPVCGWPKLRDAPRTKSGGGSFEICPSCGFEFGVSDDDQGHTYEGWRAAWVQRGMPWSSQAQSAPAKWKPVEQMRRVAS